MTQHKKNADHRYVQGRLKSYNKRKARIAALEAQILYLKELYIEPISVIKAMDLTQVKATTIGDPTGNAACAEGQWISENARKQMEAVQEEIAKHKRVIQQIDMALEYLPEPKRFAVTMKHIEGHTWKNLREEYAVKYGAWLSYNTLERHVTQAIQFMIDILKLPEGGLTI